MDSTVDIDAVPFDAEDIVWQYRVAHGSGNKAHVEQLRKEWAAWQGEDSLHEMAFGEPIERAAFLERLESLGRLHFRHPERHDAIQAEIAWLARAMSADDGSTDHARGPHFVTARERFNRETDSTYGDVR